MIYRNNISYDDVLSLLEHNPNVSKTFRYYRTRTSLHFKNHIYHFLAQSGDDIVGYGHLDYEDKIWLGMFVSDKFTGQGYGKKILQTLVNYAEKDIHLSVDKDNISAINLYLGSGFRIYDQTDKIFYCIYKK
jgi:RimJ/RimL family protein N-acetyltransferase